MLRHYRGSLAKYAAALFRNAASAFSSWSSRSSSLSRARSETSPSGRRHVLPYTSQPITERLGTHAVSMATVLMGWDESMTSRHSSSLNS
jgi:hypothetical protein